MYYGGFVADIISGDITEMEAQRKISDMTNAELCDIIIALVKIIKLYSEHLNAIG